MADTLSPAARSAAMRAVKSSGTAPELAIRKAAHGLGLRYRLHRKDLPGKPDLTFVSRRIALFVHGCFWHGHDCPRGARMPKTNRAYWTTKIARNVARDARVATQLVELAWRTAIIWECEIREAPNLDELIRNRLALDRPAPSDQFRPNRPKDRRHAS